MRREVASAMASRFAVSDVQIEVSEDQTDGQQPSTLQVAGKFVAVRKLVKHQKLLSLSIWGTQASESI